MSKRYRVTHAVNGSRSHRFFEAESMNEVIVAAMRDCYGKGPEASWIAESCDGQLWASGNAAGVVAGCY